MRRVSGVVPLLAVLVAGAGCRPVPEARASRVTGVAVDTVSFPAGAPQLTALAFDTVQIRRERTVAVLPAQLVMNEDHTVRIMSPVTGRFRTVEVEAGTHVDAGQPLARIMSSDLAQANADLTRAAAAMTQAEAALRRANDLYEHHVIAQKELEQAKTDEAQARAEMERARSRVRLLDGSGAPSESEFVLRSPIEGQVIERNANAGAEVRPDAGSVLFTVSSLDQLWLTANVFQKDAAAVHVGDRLRFSTEAVPGRGFTAVVRYVGAALDPQTRTVLIRGELQNPDRVLKPQMFGEARLVASTKGGLAVPIGALLTQGDGTAVFVQTAPGRFLRRVVTIGSDDGTYATVLDGLSAGEVVVTRGGLLLAAELSARSR